MVPPRRATVSLPSCRASLLVLRRYLCKAKRTRGCLWASLVGMVRLSSGLVEEEIARREVGGGRVQ